MSLHIHFSEDRNAVPSIKLKWRADGAIITFTYHNLKTVSLSGVCCLVKAYPWTYVEFYETVPTWCQDVIKAETKIANAPTVTVCTPVTAAAEMPDYLEAALGEVNLVIESGTHPKLSMGTFAEARKLRNYVDAVTRRCLSAADVDAICAHLCK